MPKGIKGFQKGRTKTGGNTKGSIHRSTEIRNYVEKEPIQELMSILEKGNLKDVEKAKIWADICKYFYKSPKDDINLNLNGGVEIQKVFIDEKTKKATDKHIDDFINGK